MQDLDRDPTAEFQKQFSFSLFIHFLLEGTKTENWIEARNVSGLLRNIKKDKGKERNLILCKILQIQDDYINIIRQATSTRTCLRRLSLNSGIKLHEVASKLFILQCSKLLQIDHSANSPFSLYLFLQ